MKQTREPAGLAQAVAVVTAILIRTSPAAQRRYPAAGPALRQVQQAHEVILTTASQPIRRQATSAWRTARRAAGAPRAIHDEQVLMWELFWSANRVPVDRTGPLAWTLPGRAPVDRQSPSHPRRHQRRGRAMTGTPRPRLSAAIEPMAAQAGRRLELK